MGSAIISLLVVVGFVLVMFYQSQKKFRDKILCTFIRPNKQKIEAWVPLQSKHVIFDRGKYGTGHYNVDPECITMMWFNRGINKFFPVLVPTLEFKWDTPNPLDPRTFESTWHTPEARHASWEEHEHIAFARAAALASGKKGRFPEWLFPLIIIVLIIAVLFIVYTGMGGLDERLFNLEQQVKLLR